MYTFFNNCPICNSDKIPFLNAFEKLFLLKCDECKFIFDKRIPSAKELNNHYKVYAYSKLKPLPGLTKASYHKLLDEFEKFRETGNVLDIGCGQGDFLAEAKRRKWNVYGSEYSESAIKLCKERGIDMHQGALSQNSFAEIKFDVITSFEVIEHINTPNEFMSIANNLLKQGGLFYCTTPNFNSVLRYFEKTKFKIICYPEHISFYTKKTMRFLGNKHNFTNKKLLSTGLDISRIKNSFNKNTSNQSVSERMHATQQIQNLSASNPIMRFIKKCVNLVLSLFGKGDTLKAYWIKK